MIRTRAGNLVWLALAGAFAVLGWFLIATSFMVYDDEGYVLISVRDFCAGHPLYTEVFSQYGPAFYLFYKTLHLATGVVYDHETGRLLTLGYWVATALAVGGLTARLASSRFSGWCAAVLAFVTLTANVSEPFHPGSLLTLVGVLFAWTGAETILRPGSRWGWAVGALGAFALGTKINVGVFLFCAWGGWWLVNQTHDARVRARLLWCAALGTIAFPLLLMRAHLEEAWALSFAWLFIAGALSTGWLLLGKQAPDARPACSKAWAGAAAICALTLAGLALNGTDLSALWEGMVAAPLRHPGVYTFPSKTTLWGGTAAWVSLGLFAWVSARPVNRARDRWILAIRVIGLAAYAWHTSLPPHRSALATYGFVWGLVLVPWMLIPLGHVSSTRDTLARGWLGWAFCWQVLHAYPVAGSQVAWGSVLWAGIACVGAADLVRHATSFFRYAPWIGRALLGGAALSAATMTTLNVREWWADSRPLDHPGARWIRPVPEVSRQIAVIDTNLSREAGTVFSLPGMFSFNLWSSRPTPTHANTTHWFSLLNGDRQGEIVRKLEADPRAALVVQRELLRILGSHGYAPEGLLADYLRIGFVPALRVGGYDLCFKRGRAVTLWNVFTVDRDHITARVTGVDAPTPLSVNFEIGTSLPIPEADWTRLADGDWQIRCPAPVGWRSGVHPRLTLHTPQGEIDVLENKLGR